MSATERLAPRTLTRAILAGSATALVANAAALACAFLSQLVLARALGIQEYGGFTYSFAILSVLALPAKVGFDTASARLVPFLAARGSWGELAGLLRRSGMLVVAVSVIVAVVAAYVIFALRWVRPTVPAATVAVALVALPLYASHLVQIGQLQGFRRVGLAQIPEVARILTVTVVVAGAVWVFRRPGTSTLGFQGQTVALGAAAILGAFLLRGIRPRELLGVVPEYRTRDWLKTSLPMLFVSTMFVVMKRADVLMLGSLASLKAAGAYAVASRLADLMMFGLNAANIYTGPLFSELHTRGSVAELQHTARLNARLGMAATAAAGLFLVAAGHWIFAAFGPGFVAALPALKVLAGAQLVSAASGSVGKLMTMTGHQVEAGVVLAVAATINVGLDFVLIPRYGMVGAAVAAGTATVIWNLILVVRVRQLLGVRSTVF